MSLIFHTHPKSRGRIVRWMLEECGTDYDLRLLEFGKSMQSDEYRRLNPMAKVPAIEHHGQIVTECAAICAYLADAFPAAGLAPAPDKRGAYYRWLFFAAGPVEAAITNQSLGVSPSIEQQAFVGYGDMQRVLATLEHAVGADEFIAGERFSAADVYVGSQIGFGLQFKTIEARPALTDYWSRISERQAFRKANELDDQLIATLSDQGT